MLMLAMASSSTLVAAGKGFRRRSGREQAGCEARKSSTTSALACESYLTFAGWAPLIVREHPGLSAFGRIVERSTGWAPARARHGLGDAVYAMPCQPSGGVGVPR